MPNGAGRFRNLLLVNALLLVVPVAMYADDLSLSQIQSKNGRQMSTEELKQLLPNAKVVSYLGESTRRWVNKPNGKFVASSDVARHTVMGKPSTANGTWHIDDNGKYCVTLEWPKRSESWCRYMFQVGDKYYGVKSLENDAGQALEFELE